MSNGVMKANWNQSVMTPNVDRNAEELAPHTLRGKWYSHSGK